MGYSSALDQVLGTVPTPVSQGMATQSVVTATANGTWYFHVRAENGANTWGSTTSYTLNIDSAAPVAPTVTSSDHPTGSWVTSTSVSLAWTAPPGVSGITGTTYVGLDRNPSGDPGTSGPSSVTATTVTATADSTGSADGVWFFHVRSQSKAGLWSPVGTYQVDIAGSDPAACTTQGACTATNSAAGLANYYPYAPFNLGTGSALVNMANGNLVADYTDVSVPGQGLNMSLTRTYNSGLDGVTATDGPLGKGWTLGVVDGGDALSSAVSDIEGLNITGLLNDLGHIDEFKFTDAHGGSHVFWYDGTKWNSPPGVNLVLTQSVSLTAGITYALTRPDGVSYTIALVGLGAYRVTSVTDRSGNQLCFNYIAAACASSGSVLGTLLNLVLQNLLTPAALLNPPLLSVTDGNGRKMSFTYSGSYLSEVDYQAVSGTAAPVLKTTYNVDPVAHRLMSVTEAAGTPAARTTTFGYTGSLLTSASDAITPTANTTQVAYTATSQVQKITDRAGHNWNFTYGGSTCSAPAGVSGSPVCLTDPTGAMSVWTTNSVGNLIDLRDAGDVNLSGATRYNHTSYGWANNQLVTETDAAGNATSMAYNTLGQITQTVFAGVGDQPVTTALSYRYQSVSATGLLGATTATAIGDLTEEDVGVGTPQVRTTTYAPNPDGTLASVTAPSVTTSANTTTFGYTSAPKASCPRSPTPTRTRRPTAIPASPTSATTISGQPLKITDALGHAETFGFDYLGNQVTQTDRAGASSSASYDPYGHVTQTVSPLNEKTLTCYDGDGQAVLTVSPRASVQNCGLGGTDGYSTKAVYDPRGMVSYTLTTLNGQLSKTGHTYYANGLPQHTIDPRSYDANGNLVTNPALVAQTTASYYPDGRLAASTDETGATTNYAYTPVGLAAQVTAAAHDASSGRSVVTKTYNGRGQVLTSAVSGVATPTVSTYDIFGEVTQTVDPKTNATNYTYYPTGQLHTTTYPNQTTSTQVADNVGNVTSVTQPTGSGGSTTVGYTYTVLNQVRTETDPADAQHSITYAYDKAARQTDRYDLYSGVTQTTQDTAYDADGRPVTQTATSLTAPTFASVTAYDAAGAVTSTTTTLNGVAQSSVINTLAPSGQLVGTSEAITPPTGSAVTKAGSFAYNNDGSLASRTFDAKTTYYGYQLNGEVTATTAWTGGTFTASYFPNGALATQALPNGANLAQTYDTASRLAAKTLTAPGGGNLSSWTGITYDANSNVSSTAVSQAFPAGTTPASYSGPATWTYDALNRLQTYRGPVDPSATSYTLDDAGNVTASSGPMGNTSSAYVNSALNFHHGNYAEDH